MAGYGWKWLEIIVIAGHCLKWLEIPGMAEKSCTFKELWDQETFLSRAVSDSRSGEWTACSIREPEALVE